MAYAMIAPVMLAAVLFRGVPVVAAVVLSFVKTDLMSWQWVGLANYRAIVAGPVVNTLLYVAISTPLAVLISLRIALSLKWAAEGERHAVRLLIYIPALVSGIIMASIWRYIFHYDGGINALVLRLGGERVSFFSTRWSAILPISMIDIIGRIGLGVILFLAAVKGVPDECYDAARVEGAHARLLHRLVTLPMIRETIALVTLLSALSTAQMFYIIYALAPYPHAQTVGYAMYHEAFLYGKFGTGSAYAVVMLAMCAALVMARRLAR